MAEGDNDRGGMIMLTGLWWNDGKGGRYLRGSLNGNPVLIFENKYKRSSTHPDMQMYLAKSQKRKSEQQDLDNVADAPGSIDDDDIPPPF